MHERHQQIEFVYEVREGVQDLLGNHFIPLFLELRGQRKLGRCVIGVLRIYCVKLLKILNLLFKSSALGLGLEEVPLKKDASVSLILEFFQQVPARPLRFLLSRI